MAYPGGDGTLMGLAPAGVAGDDGSCAAAITFARASSASCGRGLASQGADHLLECFLGILQLR
jgi:hypothetical protein